MTALTPRESEDLRQLEARIGSGLGSFVQVGLALLEVRDRKLYRDTYPTFETYLSARWGLGRSRAYQLMGAAGVAVGLASAHTTVDVEPQRESQLRPLVGLTPEQQVGAWAEATAGGKQPSGQDVQEAARAVLARLAPDQQRAVVEAEERAAIARSAARRPPPADPRAQGRTQAVRLLARVRKLLLRDPDAAAIVEALDALVLSVEAHRGAG